MITLLFSVSQAADSNFAPVLAFGQSCAPNQAAVEINYDSEWWVEPMYVNTYGKVPGYTGCNGGNILKVKPGNQLQTTMYLNEGTTIWTQNVTNLSTGQTALYSIDLLGQQQAWAEFIIETSGGWHKDPPLVEVTDITLRATNPDKSFCKYAGDAYALYPGASVVCETPVIVGNECKISHCFYDGYAPTTIQEMPTSTVNLTVTRTNTETSTKPLAKLPTTTARQTLSFYNTASKSTTHTKSLAVPSRPTQTPVCSQIKLRIGWKA
ncbi:hypothetical protein HDV01_007900 [Terramyces sp. JEL0728]|nr:hypothetical protein HDV01_007900 [Terramyces sp. JEL0728]